MFLSATYEVSNVSTFPPTLVFPSSCWNLFSDIKLKNDSKFKLVIQERNLLAEDQESQVMQWIWGSTGALWTTSLSATLISQPGFSLMVIQGPASFRLSSEHQVQLKTQRTFLSCRLQMSQGSRFRTQGSHSWPGGLDALTGLVEGHSSSPDPGNRIIWMKGRRGREGWFHEKETKVFH